MSKTLISNTIWLFSSQTISRILKFGLVVLAARVFGVAGFGTFSFTLSFIGIFFLLADLGINALVVRDTAREPAEGMLKKHFLLKVILILFATTTATTAILITGDPQIQITSLILIGYFVFMELRNFFAAYLQGRQRMDLESISTLVQSFVTVTTGALIVFTKPTLEGFALAYLLGSASGFITAWVVNKSFYTTHAPVQTSYHQIFTQAWPLALGSIIGTIMLSSDMILLGFLKGSESVGVYAAGSKLIQTLFLLPLLIGTAVFPTFVQLTTDLSRLRHAIEKTTGLVLTLVLPVTMGGILVAPELLQLVFGEEYVAATSSFRILLSMLILFGPSMIFDRVLFALGKQKQTFYYMTIAAVLNIILNLILIPFLQTSGAALATVLSQFVNLLLLARLASMHLHGQPIVFVSLIKAVCALIIMGIAVTLSVFFELPVLITVSIGGLIYLGTLFILRAPQIHDIVRLIKQNDVSPPIP